MNNMQTSQLRQDPHEAMFLILPYLPLFELLSMAQVCKSFRDALKHDILPWLNIVVDTPLSSRFSDDFLVKKIMSKGKGRLRIVALKNCFKITDEGLLQVIANNHHVNKLYLQGCTGLTIEGVIGAVKMVTKANHRLNNLAISGIYNVKTEDFQTLCHLMGINQMQMKQAKYNYYNRRHDLYAFIQESRPSIDVDICPKCREIRQVFDCPRDSCKRRMQQQHKNQVLMECRGCFVCVPRCEECGICTKDEELGESACADTLCLNCWLQLPKCNFCNKAYCNQHAYYQLHQYSPNTPSDGSSSLGFLCSDCSLHASQSSHYSDADSRF